MTTKTTDETLRDRLAEASDEAMFGTLTINDALTLVDAVHAWVRHQMKQRRAA